MTLTQFEYGTCWVTHPITDLRYTYQARRDVISREVQFLTPNQYWLNFNEVWWQNFEKYDDTNTI